MKRPHKDVLIALLNPLLELEGDHRILDVQRLSTEQHVAVPELKLRDDSGERTS